MDINAEHRYIEAKSLFESGYNCAQGVLLAFSDLTGLDNGQAAKIASPFGGGMGRLRETCGAVSGMLIALGAIQGYTDIHNKEEKHLLYKHVQNLIEKFREQYGSIVCAELLGKNKGAGTPHPSERNKEYYSKRPCSEITGTAAFILAEYLNGTKNT